MINFPIDLLLIMFKQYKSIFVYMPSFTWAEVSKHTTQDDCWIVINGKVFDVTSFLTKHPGGRWIILENAGKDATSAF